MPLTGRADRPTPAIADRPALVVKIDNDPTARPQSGLNQADIVFEEIVEGSSPASPPCSTRRTADPVGPIRSGRTPGRRPARRAQRPAVRLERRQRRRHAGHQRQSDLVDLSTPSHGAGDASGSTQRQARRTTCTPTPSELCASAPPAGRPRRAAASSTCDAGDDVRRRRRRRPSTSMDRRAPVRLGRGTPATAPYLRSQNGEPPRRRSTAARSTPTTSSCWCVDVPAERRRRATARRRRPSATGDGVRVHATARCIDGHAGRAPTGRPVHADRRRRRRRSCSRPGRTWVELRPTARRVTSTPPTRRSTGSRSGASLVRDTSDR